MDRNHVRLVTTTDGQPQPGPQPGGIAMVTRTGMIFLYAGIAVSMAMLFFPAFANQYSTTLLNLLPWEPPVMSAATRALCGALGITVTFTSAAVVAQGLWVVGAALLCVQPMREKAWAFMVFEVSMVLASVLPLLDMSITSAIVMRTAFTAVVMLWLGSLEGMHLCKAMLPWYWVRVWKGEMGTTALAIVGSEILCWGYSMFAINVALGWVGLTMGSVVMMHFGHSGMKAGVKIAVAWYHLNMVYVITGIIQVVWLLK